MTTRPRNSNRSGAHGNPKRHDPLPRISSIEGIQARYERRLKTFKPGDGHVKPGSHNPRKVGR